MNLKEAREIIRKYPKWKPLTQLANMEREIKSRAFIEGFEAGVKKSARVSELSSCNQRIVNGAGCFCSDEILKLLDEEMK